MSGGAVTVVVPHGDPGPSLATVRDLRHRVTDHPLQLVGVDDCSPQPSPDINGVTVVRREMNGGIGSAVHVPPAHDPDVAFAARPCDMAGGRAALNVRGHWANGIRAGGRCRTLAEHTFAHRARDPEALWTA